MRAMKELAETLAYDFTQEETMHTITELWKDVKEYERNYRWFIDTLA